MDTVEIQKRVDALVKAMLAKALPEPRAEYSIQSGKEGLLLLAWRSKRGSLREDYEFIHGDAAKALAEGDTYVAALPPPEQARMKAFMESLSETIELGKHSSIDVDFVNPLVVLMKKLSKNALTHQAQA